MWRATSPARTSPTSTCTARRRCAPTSPGSAPIPTSRPMTELTGPVEIVGTGLLGTSIGLALRRAGVEVVLSDESSDHLRTASGMGAGRPRTDADRPQLVVVAVPPDHLGDVIAESLRRTQAVVTDVGSVKSGPLASVADVP